MRKRNLKYFVENTSASDFPGEPEGALILILSYYPSVKIRLSTIYTVKGEIVPRFRIL